MASAPMYILLWSIVTFLNISSKGVVSIIETGISFTEEPRDVAGVKGQSTWLNCSATSSLGGLVVSWIKDRLEVADSSRHYEIHADGALALPSLVKKHEGQYRCVVRNSAGSIVSRIATVQVTYPSRFRVDVLPEDVHPGDNVRLQCSVKDQPLPPSYRWLKDNQPLPQNSRYAELSSGILQILNVQEGDTGLYSCTMGTGDKAYTAEAYLNFTSEDDGSSKTAFLLGRPKNSTYISGDTAVLECFAGGSEKPTISWFKDGTRIMDYWYIIEAHGNLEIPNLEVADSGTYTCQARSSGNVVTASAALKVTAPPVLRGNSDNLARPASSTVRFECYFEGNPDPQITWMHNGKVLGPGDRFKFQQKGSILVISQSQPGDSGYYQCWAENDGGTAYAVLHLYVQPPRENAPDPPVNIRALDFSKTSITLAWIPAPEKNGLGAFAFSIHYFPASGGAELQKVVVNRTTAVIQHLAPHTAYTFYLLAYNSKGASRQSERVELSTSSDSQVVYPTDVHSTHKPPARGVMPPVSILARALNATAILVRWEHAPLQADANYIVRMRLLDEEKEILGLGEQDSKIAVSKKEIVLMGLQPFSKYQIEVCSVVDGEKSAYSQPPIRVTTREAAPTEPEDVRVDEYEDGSVVVQWSPPLRPNGVISAYYIYYTTQPHKPQAEWRVQQEDSSATRAVITGLAANKVFYFRMAAENSAGHGALSLQRTIQTTTSSSTNAGASFLGASERNKGIVIGLCIGGFCIVICVVIVLLKNKCVSPAPAASSGNGHIPKVKHTAATTVTHFSSYHEMDSIAPMLPPVPVNHECDTKGGYGTYPGRTQIAKIHGLNGFSSGRTRTVSSGYTSDRDLDEAVHLTERGECEADVPLPMDIIARDDMEDGGSGEDSCSLASATMRGTAHWLGCSSPSFSGSRDSNKDSGTGTECAVHTQHSESASTLTANNSPTSQTSSIQRPSSDSHLHSTQGDITSAEAVCTSHTCAEKDRAGRTVVVACARCSRHQTGRKPCPPGCTHAHTAHGTHRHAKHLPATDTLPCCALPVPQPDQSRHPVC